MSTSWAQLGVIQRSVKARKTTQLQSRDKLELQKISNKCITKTRCCKIGFFGYKINILRDDGVKFGRAVYSVILF